MKKLPIILSIILGGVALSTFLILRYSSPAKATFSNGYGYSRSLTVANASSTQTSFPVEVSFNGASTNDLTLTNLKTVSNGGVVTSSTGVDVIFTSDSGGNSVLPFERETYASTTGASVFWVQVPSVTNGTIFYIFYGKSGAADQSNATGVWDTNFKAVYHLPNGSSLTTNDSTSFANTGTNNSNNVTAATGQIDGAGAWNNSATTYITVANSASTNITTSALTIEAWVKPTTISDFKQIVAKADGTSQPTQRKFGFFIGTSGQINFEVSAGSYLTQTGGTMSTGVWTHLVGTYNGTNIIVYKNSVSQGSGSLSGAIVSKTGAMTIGQFPGGFSTFDGLIDEVRISDTGRSSSWIATEYNNQSNVSTFLTMGGEVTAPVNWKQTGLKVLVGNVSGACGSSYKFCSTVTINNASSTQTNFPVEFSFNDGTASSTTLSTLKYNSSGGAIQSMSGYDIVFSTSSTASGLLPCEREIYTPTTGRAIIWVQVPSVVNAGQLYMFWGKPADTDHCTASAVWDSNYKGVWHYPNGTTLTNPSPDSTTNANNATPTAGITATAGQIDGAANSDGVSNHYLSGSASWPTSWTTLTYSGWFRVTNLAGERGMFQSSSAANGWGVAIQSSGQLDWYTRGVADNNFSGLTAAINKIYFFSVTRNAGTVIGYLYNATDGTSASQTLTGVTSPNNGNGTFQIGNADSGADIPFIGWLDETRVSTTTRASSWIATEYNNQYSPSTFYSLSTPTPGGAGVKVIIK